MWYHVSRVPPQGAYFLPGSASPRHITGGNSSSYWQNLSLMSWCLLISWKPAHALPFESIFRSGLVPFALPWAFQKKFPSKLGDTVPLCPANFFLKLFFWGHKSSPSRSPELYILGVPCSHIRACKEGKHLAVLNRAFHSIMRWLPRQFVLLASCPCIWVQLHQPLLLLSNQWAKLCPYLDPGTILAELQR